MKFRSAMSQKLAKRLISYDPETGDAFYLPRTTDMFLDGGHTAEHTCAKWNARYAGRKVCSMGRGYVDVSFRRTRFRLHRVIWLYMTGEWPANVIDHINGKKEDNRWCNLRQATQSQNLCNRGAQSNNTSGFKGVYLHKRTGLFKTEIQVDKKIIYLGYFKTAKEAFDVRCAELEKHHGEFARSI